MPVTTLSWTDWILLEQRSTLHELPTTAGLYRVRAIDDSAYVGHAGRSLRGRVSAIRGAFNTQMPYRDPHTAAPALWAWLLSEPAELTVSVCTVGGATRGRSARGGSDRRRPPATRAIAAVKLRPDPPLWIRV